MYKTCPKCGYKRQASDDCSEDKCPSCGLFFRKWLKSQVGEVMHPDLDSPARSKSYFVGALVNFFIRPRINIKKSELIRDVVIWLIFIAWGLSFVMMDFRSNEIGQSWFHNVNLVFHEAGHVIFTLLGRTMAILGGSLFQVLVPLALMFACLVVNKDSFGASIGLWWVGQSLMDIAPYIADARALRLPLLGGSTGADRPGTHDWANLLRPRGWLEYDIQIAAAVDFIGSGILLLALLWGGYMLYLSKKGTDLFSSNEIEK